jgi:hypothetical protein
MALTAAPLTRAELKDIVRVWLGEATEGVVKHNDIYDALNAGMRDLARRLPDDCFIADPNSGTTESLSTIGQANLAADTETVTIPADMLRPVLLRAKYPGQTAFRTVSLCSPEALFAEDTKDEMEASPDAPKACFFYGSIYLRPIPSANVTNGLEVYYIREPKQLAADGDEPEIMDPYRTLLVYYAAGACLHKLREEGRASLLMSMYESGVQEAMMMDQRTVGLDRMRDRR